ncbi:hypothetical protein GCM10022240_11740 [Microbacterium kribbense]|uniref:Uncharacterized protein n=1 Tax=Microbacterium kribbense TaxID=433645 RepID=A0ABP7GAR0_9MICO
MSGIEVVGTVVNIELLLADGARVEIARVPSGSALLGLNPYDDGAIVTRWTEEALDMDGAPQEFLVTLDLAR